MATRSKLSLKLLSERKTGDYLDVEYPALVERAAHEEAEIAWGDESGLRSDAQTGRGYSRVALTPEIDLSQKKRHRINFIASLNNQGLVRFMLYAGQLDSWVFITFLERLIELRSRMIKGWGESIHNLYRQAKREYWQFILSRISGLERNVSLKKSEA